MPSCEGTCPRRGAGTPLRTITQKRLIPVANNPVLVYGPEQFRDAGITDIGIIVGDTRDVVVLVRPLKKDLAAP